MQEVNEQKKAELANEAVFPCVLKILPEFQIRKKDPIIIGVTVLDGIVKVGTPICIPEADNLEIGRVASVEKEKKPVESARKGVDVCVKIQGNASQTHLVLGRHFSSSMTLYSKISRPSIECLKEHYQDDMTKDDWRLIMSLKKVFNIDGPQKKS